jgi:parallel beta-helix repeat protein
MAAYPGLTYVEYPYNQIPDPDVCRLRRIGLTGSVDVNALIAFLDNISSINKILLVPASQTLECIDPPTPVFPIDNWGYNDIIFDLMNLNEVWGCTTGSSDIEVAICDQWLGIGHEDLDYSKITIFPTPNLYGQEPSSLDLTTSNLFAAQHGYGITGTIASQHNSVGIAGVAPASSFRFYSVGSDPTHGDPSLGIEQILREFELGNRPLPKVINVSYDGIGGVIPIGCTICGVSPLVPECIDFLLEQGTTIVVGSSPWNTTPASYWDVDNQGQKDGVINCTFTDHNLNYINYNAGFQIGLQDGCDFEYLAELTTPAYQYGSLQHPNTYKVLENWNPPVDGSSSHSTALVSGVVALMLAGNPCLAPSQIEHILKNTSLPIHYSTDTYNYVLGDNIPLPSWECTSNDGAVLPEHIAGSIDAWAAYQACIDPKLVVNNALTITQDRSYQEITIEAGGELIIDGADFTMHENGRIFVKRGGKLNIINQSSVTSCSGRWAGIVLEGNNNEYHDDLINNAITNVADQPAWLVMNNSTLENAKEAISSDAGNLRWNALIQVSNSTFRNNWRSVALMSSRVDGQTSESCSEFIDCTFVNPGGIADKYGITNWDAQGILIQRCHFINMERDAIHTIDGTFDIIETTIDNDLMLPDRYGIRLWSTGSVSGETNIGNPGNQMNTISRTKTAITLEGASNVKIHHNMLRDNILGMYVEGGTTSDIYNNDFSNNYWSIGQLATGFTGFNTFDCNRFSSVVTGYYDFYNFGYVKNTDFDGNLFSDDRPSFKLFQENEVSGIGLVGQISHQGSESSPRTNRFNLDQLCNRVNTGNLNSLFDYWYAAPPANDPTNADYARMKATCSLTDPFSGMSNFYNSYLGEENYEPLCTAGTNGLTTGDPDCTHFSCYTGLVSTVEALRADSQANPSDLDYFEKAAYRTLLHLVNQLVSQADYTGAISLLEQHSLTETWRVQYGVRLHQGDITSAERLLDNISQYNDVDNQFFVVTQRINIRFRKDLGSFKLSGTERANLNQIANALVPSSANAKALLVLFDDQHFDVITPDPTHQNLESANEQKELGMVCYPNPTSGMVDLRCNFDRIGKTCVVTNMMGRAIYEFSLEEMDSVDLSGFPDGVYFMTVVGKGSILYRTSVVLFN